MSEPQETRKPNRFRITSIIIAVLMIIGAFGLLIGPIARNVSATITGDAYSGSGDWIITNSTVYTGETLTVYGNISIEAGARLTLSNSHLIISCPAGGILHRYINVSIAGMPYTSNLIMGLGSNLSTTNHTDNTPNVEILIGNTGYIQIDHSTLSNVCVADYANLDATHIHNSTLHGTTTIAGIRIADCTISDYAGNNNIFSIAGMDPGGYLNRNTFSNITLSGKDVITYSIIRILGGTHFLRIEDNHFEQMNYPIFFASANLGQALTDISITGNTIDELHGTTIAADYIGFFLGGDAPPFTIRNSISNNIFKSLENGTMGIQIAQAGWTISGNQFDRIDGSIMTSSVCAGIYIMDRPGHIWINGTIINKIVGPPTDIGATGEGIFSYLAGNYTVQNSIMRNITWTSNGIASSMGTQSNIVINNNTMDFISNASNAIGVFGGSGAIVSGNIISHVERSSGGIRIAGSAQNTIIRDNSIINHYVNVPSTPGLPGMYNAHMEGIGKTAYFYNNTADDCTDAEFPTYYFTGDSVGTGLNIVIRTMQDVKIKQFNTNVAFESYGNVLLIPDSPYRSLVKGTVLPFKSYLNFSGVTNHYTNVIYTTFRISTNGPSNITPEFYDLSSDDVVAKWTATSSTPSTTMTFTLSGLESGRMYRLYIDGNQDALLTASGSGVISFTYSGPWSEHQFEIVATSITGSISPLINLIFIMFAIGIVVGVVAEGTNSLRKMQMRTTEQMTKSLLNMVIYIVIGIASLGVLYRIVV